MSEKAISGQEKFHGAEILRHLEKIYEDLILETFGVKAK